MPPYFENDCWSKDICFKLWCIIITFSEISQRLNPEDFKHVFSGHCVNELQKPYWGTDIVTSMTSPCLWNRWLLGVFLNIIFPFYKSRSATPVTIFFRQIRPLLNFLVSSSDFGRSQCEIVFSKPSSKGFFLFQVLKIHLCFVFRFQFYESVQVMRERMGSSALRCVGYGHLGDGNMHLNITTK